MVGKEEEEPGGQLLCRPEFWDGRLWSSKQDGRAWGSGCSGGRLLQKCLAQGGLGAYMLSLEGTLTWDRRHGFWGLSFQVESGLDPVVKAVKLHWDELTHCQVVFIHMLSQLPGLCHQLQAVRPVDVAESTGWCYSHQNCYSDWIGSQHPGEPGSVGEKVAEVSQVGCRSGGCVLDRHGGHRGNSLRRE